MTFTLRSARPDDSAAISRLVTQLGYSASAADIGERLGILLTSERFHVVVAASDDGEVLGWISAERRLTLESGTSFEIVGLVVDGAQRRGGVGRALVAAAEAWAAARGATSVRVRSNVVRGEAHPFYESLGYERKKTQHAYARSLTPDPSTEGGR